VQGDPLELFPAPIISAVERCPELIGWAYQIWNEGRRSASTWAISYKSQEQAERLSVAVATQIFTEEYIADFLLVRCHLLLASSKACYDVMDPACGTGHILARALVLWSNHQQASDAQRVAMLERLYGCDIDGVAIELCRVIMLLRSIHSDATLCAPAWQLLNCTIQHLPTVEGALLRDDATAVLQKQYDCVVTNPPYLGRRKLREGFKQFLDQHYPTGAIDLCAAFMQRCIELLKPHGVVGFVTSDKWLRLKGYRSFRVEEHNGKGLYNELTLDVLAELGDRAFNPQLDLHDGVGVVLTVGRKAPPPSDHLVRYLLCTAVRDWRAKANYLSDKVGQQECGVSLKQSALQSDSDGSVFLQAGGAPHALVHARRRISDCARIVIGLQTNDDARFVKYHWQVAPNHSCWRVHGKGGGYARWYGLNRWVLDIRDSDSFLEGGGSGAVLNDLFAKEGWTYSWFANGALGLRRKEAGWSFGRAASSGVYCDNLRVVAYLNSRLSSFCVRLKGGKIQLPEGVVRGVPLPDELEAVDPRLVEAAVDIKRELVAADPTDYTFRPAVSSRVYERFALEALVLMVEAELERQVMRAAQLSEEDAAGLAAVIAPPVGFLSQGKCSEVQDFFWRSVPDRWQSLRGMLERGESDFSLEGLESVRCNLSVSDLERLLFARAVQQEERAAFPATGPLERISRRMSLHPSAALYALINASRADSAVKRRLEESDIKIIVLVTILKLLGFSWWSQGSIPSVVRSVTPSDVEDAARVAFTDVDFTALSGGSLAEWVSRDLLAWHEKLFLGVPILHACAGGSSPRFSLVGQLS
jgi:hypothetical protein